MTIEDGFARTTIDQTYFNETWGRLEGTFYFPLPPDAVLSRLAMYVKDGSDCRLMEGGMAERDHARNVYETILHTRRDPALLEWVDGSTFKMRVFPLEAREEKRVLLSYTQKLSTLYGTTRYRFPAGHSLEAAVAWWFEARVKHGAALHCASASHPGMKSRTEGDDKVLHAQGEIGKLKDDVTLEIRDGAAEVRAEEAARFSTMTLDGAQYLMLRYRPRMAGQPKRERRDWAFLYEASASRDPLLARAQIDVLRGLLENAEYDDTFTLLAAGTRLRVFDDKARLATPANVKEAVKFLEGVQLIGALDLGQALTALEPALKTAKNPYLVHVGSGIATIGERRDNVLVQKIPQGSPMLFNRGNYSVPWTVDSLSDANALVNVTLEEKLRKVRFKDLMGTASDVFGTQSLGGKNYTGGTGQAHISTANPFYYYFASPLAAGNGPSVNLVPQNSLTFSTGEPTKLITGKGIFGAAMADKTIKLWLSYREEQNTPLRLFDGLDLDLKSDLLFDWVASNQQPPSLLYQRPVFTADPRYFGDLLQYAPGMQATLADIEATVEAEANPQLTTQSGTVAAAARKIVEKARTADWFQIAVPAEGRQPAYVLFFNGLGHFACERVLACGLRERVICDGTTLWHLYPEIGVGARRPFSRFHRAEFSAAIPWLLPPLEELAHGADVTLVDAHTIALVPRGDEFLQTHLRFDDDGRLTERQIVRMPAKTVVYRQCYAADGTVTVEGEAKGKVLATAKLQVASAQAPTLKPATGDLVIVPMPLRTATHLHAAFPGEYTKLEEEPAIRLAASYCVSGNIGSALELVCRRFFARGDRRIGFYVLLASAGAHPEPTVVYRWVDADKGTLCDIVADHPRVPLATYLAHHFAAQKIGPGQPVKNLGDIGGSSDGFLQRLGQFRDLLSAWQNSRLAEGDEPTRTKLRETTLQFIGKSPLPDFDWALLDTMLQGSVAVDPKLHEAMNAAAKRAGESIGLSYGVRYEMARSLWNAGHREEARKAWRQLYQDALKACHLPAMERDFRTALNEGPGSTFDDLLREAAATFVQRGQRLQTLALAWQVHQLDSTELANDLVARCVQGAEPGAERNLARLGVVHFYVQTSQPVRADTLLKLVLAEEPFRKNAALWRLSSQLAGQRGQLARSMADLEVALDLEFANLPAVVDLQHVRSDYTLLLTQYQQYASAMVLLEKEVPAEFLTKVVRAADRWRSLDPDPTQVCQMTAKILQTVGAMDLAWDYLTTPMGLMPNEAAPWLNLARVLQGDGHLELADKAFALAFDAEPTNAQILWERAENLQQMSRVEDARAVYRVLAEGTWQPRFQWMQTEARKK